MNVETLKTIPFSVKTLAKRKLQLTLGYLECLGQPSMATMILWPASVDA